MQFRSRDGKTKRLALTDGRVWLIGADWKFLPDSVHSEAYAIGCVSEDMVRDVQEMTLPDTTPVPDDTLASDTTLVPDDTLASDTTLVPVAPENRHSTILEKMREMIASGDEGTMTAKGLPNKKKLTELTGFAPTQDEFTKAWAVIISEQ